MTQVCSVELAEDKETETPFPAPFRC